jgi:hypothetical protein
MKTQPLNPTASRRITHAQGVEILSPFFQNGAQAKRALKGVAEGDPINWKTVSHSNRCVQCRSISKAAGKGLPFIECTTNLYYEAQPWPNPVCYEDVSKLRMVAGGEDRISHVIHAGKLKYWVAVGWVEIREATEQDYYQHPVVLKHQAGVA